MCGIVGCMAHNNFLVADYQKMFRELVIVDSLRGYDSTGIVSLVGKKKLYVHKEAVDGMNFTYSRKFNDILYKHSKQHKFLLAHNRAATIGDITDESAHPFMFSKIVGVHNGTITAFGSWAAKDKDMHQYTVDSQQLYFLINKYGVDETLKEVTGSYALVYFDMVNKTLNFLRNHDRPLWIARQGSGTMWWASERDMLELILRRNGYKTGVDYTLVPANTLWSYKMGDTSRRSERKNCGVKPYIPPSNNYRRSRRQTQVGNTIYALPEPEKDKRDSPISHIRSISNNYTTHEVDLNRSYLARVTHTEIDMSGQFLICGVLQEKPHSPFVCKDGRQQDATRFGKSLITVKPTWYNNKKDEYVVRITDIKLASEQLKDLVQGPGNTRIPRSEYEERVGCCAACGEDLSKVDPDKVFWDDEYGIDTAICENCIGMWDFFKKADKDTDKFH